MSIGGTPAKSLDLIRSGGPDGPTGAFVRAKRIQWGDALFKGVSLGCALLVIVMMGALIVILTRAAVPSFERFGWSFFTTSEWRPNELQVLKRNADGRMLDADGNVTYDSTEAAVDHVIPPSFGAVSVIYGTATSSFLALVFAVPASIGCAIFLVRIAPRIPTTFPIGEADGKPRHFTFPLVGTISFIIEFLAAIPSIAYGLWGLFVLAPFLQAHLEPALNNFFSAAGGWSVLGGHPLFFLGWLHFDGQPAGRDMFCGSLILAIMILPIITAISRDVLRTVPRAQIEATQALGATWWQSVRLMLRYSKSGLFGAVILGLARAAGETMAVTMVIGNVSQVKASPFAAAQSMSSLLANEFAEADPGLQRSALLEVALILLVMSLVFNIVARTLVVGKGGLAAAAH